MDMSMWERRNRVVRRVDDSTAVCVARSVEVADDIVSEHNDQVDVERAMLDYLATEEGQQVCRVIQLHPRPDTP